MKNEYEDLALDMLSAMNSPKLSEKVPDLKNLAMSEDGQRIKEKFADSDLVKKAMKSGDTGDLQRLLTSVLQTEEGQRLAKQLNNMFK